jgi:hypothetical protein
VDPNVIFRFVLALVLAPVVLALAAQLPFRGARVPFAVAYACVLVADAAAIFMPVTPGLPLEVVHNAALALAGLAVVATAWSVRGQVKRAVETPR